MKTFKRILGIALDVLIVLIFVASIVLIFFNSNKDQNGNTIVFGKTFFSVASDSMDPTIKVGDVIICDVITDDVELEVGDVISFLDSKKVDGVDMIITNTHRIVKINPNGTIITRGDNEKFNDPTPRVRGEVIAVWHGARIPLLGGLIEFLKTPAGFICCLIIPILAIIAFEAYKLITWSVSSKKQKMREELASEGPSEEMKDAIIKEYLAKQNQAKQEDKGDDK